MAKLTSFITIIGSIGNITFYKNRHGKIMRSKAGVTAERIKSDPAFEGTRKNMTEFGSAGKAGKLLRNALDRIVQCVTDEKLSNRLTKTILKIVKGDASIPFGERRLTGQNARLLTNFQFNEHADFDNIFTAGLTAAFDRKAGIATVAIPPFNARTQVKAPEGATHLKLLFAGCVINFADSSWNTTYSETDMLELRDALMSPDPMAVAIEAGTGLPVFTAIGIKFYKRENIGMCEMNNRRFSAAKIIGVDV